MGDYILKMCTKWYLEISKSSYVDNLREEWKKRQLLAKSSDIQPTQTWDHNWDRRDVDFLVKPCKNENDPKQQEKFDEKKAKLVPTATRHIFLIRHGQYEDWRDLDKDRKLTELGLTQAEFVGQRLKDLKFPYTKIIRSTMTRARETAEIIHKYLPDLPMEYSEMLREGNPIPTEPPIGTWREPYKYYTDGPRIEGAFRQYFHRADAQQKSDSYEIIVCHANVIRYFVCRLLQVPPEAWLRFSLYHCSITRVAIRPNGYVSVLGYGECGFMPKDKMTKQ